MFLLWLTLLTTSFTGIFSYKVLAIFPHPGKSHFDVYNPLIHALAQRGHHLTVLSFFPHETLQTNCTHVCLDYNNTHGSETYDLKCRKDSNTDVAVIAMKFTAKYVSQIQQILLQSSTLKEFIKSSETFDVVIASFFTSDGLLGLMHKFKAPLIGLSPCTILHWMNERFGNPTHPAYIPHTFMDYSNQLSFWERTENLVVGMVHQIFYNTVMAKIDENFVEQLFQKDMPPLATIVNRSSLFLVNSYSSLTFPRPLVPPVLEVGGVHVGKTKELDQNLEKWINESAHGVIYFSLGSMIKGHTFPEEKRGEFLKAFGRLPHRVLWKWENETMPGKPDNVMIQKWMPQLDILCHPNVKAFISHGGLLGTTEAVHCGVPVLVMPQYGDQFTNAKALEANGGGVILYLHEATEEKVYNALTTILDPNFKKQAEELSARFRDRPLPPLETAIYWVEYVARHRGAHHMRTAAVDMPLYKYLLLDVIAFLLLVFGVVSFLFFYVTRAVFRKLFGRRDKQKTN